MTKILKNILSSDRYDVFLIGIIVLYFGAKLYINEHIWGVDIGDMVDLKSNTGLTAAFRVANLPVNYLLEFLYKTLGLSSEFIKAMIALFGIATITICIYKISLSTFENKRGAILAVVLFLFSSLYFSVSAAKPIGENNLTTLCFSFLMLGILYWLKDRYVLASLFIGLSFDCHPIYPIALILVFFAYSLIRYKIVTLKTVVLSLFVFLITTSPVTFSVAKSALFTVKGSASGTPTPELIWRYIRVAQPEMAFVDIRPEFHMGFSIYFASFLLLSLFYVYGGKTQREIFIKLFLLMLTTISFGIFDNLNSYHFKIITVMNLWLNRFTSYGSMMAYVILAGMATYTISPTKINRVLQIWVFLLLCFSVLYKGPLWLIHFLILETVLVYFIYNFIRTRRELSYKALTFNIGLLSAALAYFYYLAICHEYPTGIPFANVFSLDGEALFFQAFLYHQFKEFFASLDVLRASYPKLPFIVLAVLISSFLLRIRYHIETLGRNMGRYTGHYIETLGKGVGYYTGHYIETLGKGMGYYTGHYIGTLGKGVWYPVDTHKYFPGIKLVTGTLIIVSSLLVAWSISKNYIYPGVVPLESPFAAWNMDAGTVNEIADSQKRYPAISFNAGIVEGQSGKARYLNGKDSFIQTMVNLQGWKGVTISFWVKPERKDGDDLSVILDNGHDAKNNFAIQSADINNPNSGRWVFHCNGSDISLTIPLDQWTYVVIAANAKKGIIQASTNYVEVYKATIGKFEFGDTPLTIGKLAKTSERYFKGSIDEVTIWDKTR